MDRIDETKDLLQKLEPILGSRNKLLWYTSITSNDSAAGRRNLEILRLLAGTRARVDYQERIRLPPPMPEVTQGPYHVGSVIYPDREFSRFGLTEEDLIRHVLIAGMTGSGKTTLSLLILRQLRERRIPFMVFDFKQNYRQLANEPGEGEIRVIRIGDKNCSFHFNPLIPPPGMDARHWMTIFIDVCKHAFFLGHGVEYFMRKAIDSLYRQYRIYEGSTVYPTFVEMEKMLVKEYVKGREMLWMSSAKRAVASLTFKGILREVLNVSSNGSMQELLQQNVIIEMDNLASLERTFLIEAMMLWFYHYKKNLGRSPTINHLTLLEEAHHVLSERKERAEGEETVIEMSLRMVREFGEGLIVVDQQPSKLSQSVLANTATKICFNLGSGKDIQIMGSAMNLTYEEQRHIDKLKIGEAIVKSKTRFHQPIQVRVPFAGSPDMEPRDSAN